jgi:glucose-6-phosphate dehydrogenase assembly protein OpcA
LETTVSEPEGKTEEKVETFQRGGAIEVPPGRIEAELSALWRAAASREQMPVTRACLWNLIVRCQGEEDFRYTKKLIDDVSERLPARVIVLRPEPSQSEGAIQAWVEANWRCEEKGVSGSDEVTLLATGRSVDRLLSLVRSLTIPDAPTAMMWIGAPAPHSAPVRELLKEVDRLVVDTRRLPSDVGLVELAHLGQARPELELVDLSWLGISPLRGLLAALFDPPHDPSPLEQIERVRVASGVRGMQARGLLALGWLGARLGFTQYRRIEVRTDVRRWQATRRLGGSVELELVTDLSGANHGVTALELESRGDRWSLHRDKTCIDVRAPGLPERLQPARSHSDAELTVTALGARGRDPVYREALFCAAQLVEAA